MEEEIKKYEAEFKSIMGEKEENLRNKQKDIEKHISEIEEKNKYTSHKEEIPELKEANSDFKKINDELKKTEKEFNLIKQPFTDRENAKKEIEKLNKEKESLLKNRSQCEKEIKSNGAGKDEALKDMLKLDAKLKEIEKDTETNNKIIKESEEKIINLAEIYNVKGKNSTNLNNTPSKERPSIVVDGINGKLVYDDKNGKKEEFDMFKENDEKEGQYESVVTKNKKNNIKQYAISRGVPRRNARAIDENIYMALSRYNPDLIDTYIESLKGENKDKGFDLTYNFKEKDKTIERKIGRKNIRNLFKKAFRQEKLGIAVVLKEKSKAKFYAILATLGLTGLSAIYGHNNKPAALDSGSRVKLEQDVNRDDLKTKEKDKKVDNKKNEKKQEKDNLKKDKFGNRIEKTEEEKIADENAKNERITRTSTRENTTSRSETRFSGSIEAGPLNQVNPSNPETTPIQNQTADQIQTPDQTKKTESTMHHVIIPNQVSEEQKNKALNELEQLKKDLENQTINTHNQVQSADQIKSNDDDFER